MLIINKILINLFNIFLYIIIQKEYKDGEDPCDVVKSEPLVDWIAENYGSFGAKLNFISDKSPEGF